MIKSATLSPPNIGYVGLSDAYGGQHMEINLTKIPSDISELTNWLRDFKTKYEWEEKLRQENPVLADAYDSYKMVLNLVSTNEGNI